jgi:hypothetical protein
MSSAESSSTLLVATWNVAAINNNPFEYWVTYPDNEYNDFMLNVEKLVGNCDEDVEVSSLFTDSMFSELVEAMRTQKLNNLEQLSKIWHEDYKGRKAIQGFLKDKSIGEKRLTSMPDRITNTISLLDGSKLYRPSVINAYQGPPLASFEIWWGEWMRFMFATRVQLFDHASRDVAPQLVCSLIAPIHRNKYPAISAEEQAVSVPLQLLCLAILDAIFLHIVHSVAPLAWERLRRTLCRALIDGKDDRVCQILAEAHADRHVIFLQEASSALVRAARAHPALRRRYAVLLPDAFDARRDQVCV